MSTIVVETPRIVATLPTRPQDGDDAYMDAGAAPLMPVLQHLYDAAGALRIAVLGQMSGGDRMSVDAGGTSTVFAVRVSRVVGLLSRQTGSTPIYATYTAAETVLDLTDVDSAPANLSNDTWYYVYAFCDGTATTAFYISTTAPEASLTWRTGAEGVDRYVGCFRTSSAGAPLPFMARRGRYEYDLGAMATSGAGSSRVLTAGAATSHTAVDCSGVVPPHVQNARLLVGLAPALAGDTFSTRRTGTSTASKTFYAASTLDFVFETETLLSTDQEFDYRVTSGAAVNVNVMGFSE